MANDFSSDANCKALWRFENGALTADSKSTNTLTATASPPTADTVNYKEGSAASDFEAGSDQWFSIVDASLAAGFPLKNGVGTAKISVTFWFKPESLYEWRAFINKNTTGKRSFSVAMDASFRPTLHVGYDAGAVGTIAATWPTALSAGKWYFAAATVQQNGANIDWTFTVWDDTAGANLGGDPDMSGSVASETWNIGDAVLYVGCNGGSTTYDYDGLIDEMVIFDDVLTADEIDQIRLGTYGASSSSSSLSSSSFSSSSSSLSSASSISSSSSASSVSSSSAASSISSSSSASSVSSSSSASSVSSSSSASSISSSSSASSVSSSSSSASSISSSLSSASSVSSSASSISSSSSYSFSSSSTSSAGPLEFVSLGKGVDMAIREEVADAGLLASDPSAGRRLVTDPIYKAAHRHKLSISYMSVSDRILLARFYLTTTTGACRVWEWTHPKSDQVWLLRFDPQVPPVYGRHAEQPDKHHAELTVLEDITDGYVLGVYDR
ncbi:MAG TPA: LamG domain-containing protein [Phycisphaerae bacterium]|nr:LamG domain-containing protein [Phycisphaerae bacterium]